MKSIGFIGGDLRQLTLMNNFKSDGYDVKIYAYDTADYQTNDICKIWDCDYIVFPMPTCNSNKIFTPFCENEIYINDIHIPSGKVIFYGGANDELKSKLDKSESVCIDYLNLPELAIKNAIPTAEGAIEILMTETASTVFGSDILITGFGRVAKALARQLYMLGANITIAARKKEALADAWSCGYNTVSINDIINVIGEYPIVFNTVPAKILTSEILKSCNKNTLITDLASKPGGVDFEAAKLLGLKVIWALSLPGKTAPITAGNIIYETISSIINEMVVNNNGA